MATVAVMSDLHLEFEYRGRADLFDRRRQNGAPWLGPRWRRVRDHGVDAVLLPGDIDPGLHESKGALAVEYGCQVSDWVGAPVLIVAGNHEYYRHDLTIMTDGLRRAAANSGGRVHFLECDAFNLSTSIGKLTVLGCTLWTDYTLFGNRMIAMACAGQGLSDHNLIREGGLPWTPDRALVLHERSRAFLERSLARADPRRTIVMTHHAPSRQSIPARFQNDLLSAAYASDMEDLMVSQGPALWVHGHVHDPVDYSVGRTRVLAHPRGYLHVEAGAARREPLIVALSAP